MRKESRGWFLREDYPATDNENWLKWIIVKKQDGKMTLSTEDVPWQKWPIKPNR
jgi:succinate dehydrogenase/fumarate reductase flavoprotein subunit